MNIIKPNTKVPKHKHYSRSVLINKEMSFYIYDENRTGPKMEPCENSCILVSLSSSHWDVSLGWSWSGHRVESKRSKVMQTNSTIGWIGGDGNGNKRGFTWLWTCWTRSETEPRSKVGHNYPGDPDRTLCVIAANDLTYPPERMFKPLHLFDRSCPAQRSEQLMGH